MTNMTGNLSDSMIKSIQEQQSHMYQLVEWILNYSHYVPVIGMIIIVTKNLLIAKDLIIPQDVCKFLKTLIKSFQICYKC